MTANRLVLLAAVPLFLVLAVVSYITYQFAANERVAQGWVRHTYQVMEATRILQDDVQTAESSQRAFLIDRDPVYYQTYKAAVARVPSAVQNFRQLTADNTVQQRRADKLRRLAASRLNTLARNIALATDPRTAPSTVAAALALGRGQMAALRGEITGALQEESRLLAERDRRRHDTENLEIAFAISAAILTLVILLLSAAILVRNNVNLAAAENARAKEATILQDVLETVREGIAYFTADGLLCAFNSRFFTLLDLPRELGHPTAELSAFQKLEVAHSASVNIFQPARSGEDTTHATTISQGDHELEVYKAPLPTGGFIVGVNDVTARLRAEAMMRQAQKMEAIGRLTGGVAHDFNNLLQIISANLDMATGEVGGANPRLRERLLNAIGAVARGSRLTRQLLAFARRQPLEPKSVDLGRIVRDIDDMLHRTLGETIELETVIAGGLWNTLVDPNQVENVILNLAINARDAMPEGGKLTLEVSNSHLDDAYASMHSEVTPGQYVMLAVTDTGTGMTPQVKARVFEPFFTTKPDGLGTGLGLAQAFGFTKQTGGHIAIYSELGEGTTIRMYLPRTRRQTDLPDPSRVVPAEGGSERILVVEDDEGVRAAVVDMLTELGYQVSRANNAQSALELLTHETPDLIFTDVVMPGPISTREFTRRARDIHPKVFVLYTSGYTQNAIVHNGKLDDDALLLSKPYRRDELARKLRSVFAGTARGAIASPSLAIGNGDSYKSGRRGKVLVVEDEAMIRMATVDMLEQIGFGTVEACDAAQALSILQKDDGIEILLTDLGLPGMNGRQLVEEALRLKPSLKVIIASGYSTDEKQAVSGVGAHLSKPFDLAQLRRVLEA